MGPIGPLSRGNSVADQDRPVRVRFAPSPTGKLHVGGARTAIFNWAFARANHGTFILRIDDTDPTRSTEENTQIILRAMKWLGLDWDEGPEVGGDFGPYKQTDRMDLYRKAAEDLVKSGNAYYCFCTPEKLAEDKRKAQERKDPFQGYQRTCRNIDPAEAQARVDAGEPHTIRIKVPLDRGDVVVHDAVHGDVVFDAKELDDFIIFRSDGTPTYNFATVVDDSMMGITHVIRGDDHLSNTPRQIMVYEALGAPVPTFAHISMILGPDGKKLSKRHGATSVEEYRDAGYLSDAFVNYLALLGWSPDGETTIVPRDVLAKTFSLEHVSKNPATFDPKKLDSITQTYLMAMSDAEFAETVLLPELQTAGLEPETP
ncbi:MAG: glutamate--tRNA ligase, partial [Atopobiaceae bacterium]|nr:glutamate--tRNA ligase [Atopobiaceae bacterium]